MVIAYSDINNDHVYDAGDVMIAKIVDTIRDNKVGQGDTIMMGKYPTSPAVVTPAGVRGAFEDWRVKTHTVASVAVAGSNTVGVKNTTGGTHFWHRTGGNINDEYLDDNAGAASDIIDDDIAGANDSLFTNPASPSQPTSSLYQQGSGTGDDGLIDVEIYS